jgi:peptidoglycan/xylan/chitin deacetylase (PgdA/CDA1 family)
MLFRADRFTTLYLFQPLSLLRGRQTSGIPILMYHSISEPGHSGVHPYYETATAPGVFAEHLKFLHEHNFQTVGLSDIPLLTVEKRGPRQNRAEGTVDGIKRRPSLPGLLGGCHTGVCYSERSEQSGGKKPVVITFDDGFQDFYSQAFPLLDRYGYQATMFLPTAYIGNRPMKFNGTTCLTWSQVRELNGHGVDFGSHTVNHPQLADVEPKQADYELRESKLTLEDRLGCAVDSFAYPYAFPVTNRLFKTSLHSVLENCGYRNGVTTIVGTADARDDVFFMKRLPVNSHDDLRFFRAKLEGGYDWTYAPQYVWKKLKPRRR